MLKPHQLFQPFTFFLGAYRAHWLGLLNIPLILSRRTLAGRKSFPRALSGWIVDSGGFNEIESNRLYLTGHRQYANELLLWQQEIGNLIAASIQDWPCTISALKRTGLSVAQHQERTVGSYCELRALEADLPIIPILTGLEPDDFLRHCDLYESCGVRLDRLPLVGVGGIARRQTEPKIVELIKRLKASGLNLHGFGVKKSGLKLYADALATADSMSWSYEAWMESRHGRRKIVPECTAKSSCKACLHYALSWREDVLSSVSYCHRENNQLGFWPTGGLPHYKDLGEPPWGQAVRDLFAKTFPAEMLPGIVAEAKRNVDIIGVAFSMADKQEKTALASQRTPSKKQKPNKKLMAA